ncbi:MAG: MFS transporter [Sphingomonadales bacterium]
MALLLLVYTFNFIDRQIVGILAIPIKADLGLSDTQLGLMGGLAFALFYTSLGIPIALLADRANRTWIITISLALWSLMTAVCGLAQNFWHLFLARLGVGVGEAGGTAPSYSLITDYFPPQQRARALAVYAFGIPVGSAIGIAFGGVISSLIDWRVAFFAVGLAGVLLAPIFKWAVREPPRGRYDRTPRPAKPATLAEVMRVLLRKPSFWLITLAGSSASMAGYGLIFWLPSFFVRSFSISLIEASLLYGAMLLVGGIIGLWFGGVLADRMGRKSRAAYGLVPAAAFALTVPFFVFGVIAPDLWLAAMVLSVPTALSLGWLGPTLAAIQHMAPPYMRATTSAIFLFVNNLLGIGLGTTLIGAISDGLTHEFGDQGLRYAILSATVFYVTAAAIFWLASSRLARDWED